MNKLHIAALAILWTAGSAPALMAAPQPDTPPTLELSAASEAEHHIEIVTVSRKYLTDPIAATATIEPDPRRIARVTPRMRARVLRLIADPGQRVKAGQPLAILNSIELGKAKTEYLKARALQDIARQHLTREESLYQRKISSMKDVLEARAAYDTALAQYQAARETLSLLIPPAAVARVSWSDKGHLASEFALLSPIAGTVVKRDLVVGQIVNPETEVFTVMDLDRLWVMARIFEHDLAGLSLGVPAVIRVDAYPNETFRGTVSYISDTIDPATRTVQARIEVPNPQHRLKPGMFAHAQIVSGGMRRAVLAVPASAVYQIDGDKAVFVEVKPHVFVMRPVALGTNGGNDVEVLSGLHAGDRVVSRGGLVLKSLLVNGAD